MTTEQREFLEAATAIGAGLTRDALWDGARCNWLGDVMEYVFGSWQVVHRSYGGDFYGGTSGIALFLARLYQVTGEKLFRLTAEGAAGQCLSRAELIPPAGRLAYYSGSVGMADALMQVGEALERSDLFERGFGLLESACREEPAPNMLDVIGGIAGVIPPLLKIHAKYRKDWLLDCAVRLGEKLMNLARKAENGWSWTTLEPAAGKQQFDLTGFSHGVGGIAWALLELHRQTGREDFLEAANQGIRYEQHWYQADQENWPDFRNDPITGADGVTRYSCSVAWCHGAPGIALGRLRAFAITGDPEIRKQAEAALRTTSRSLAMPMPGTESYCLCHGTGGNVEALIYASQVFSDDSYLNTARQIGQRGIELYHKAGLSWPCGVMNGGENPSMLIGLAGIGYFYLRLYDPARFPSVLIVHEPEDVQQ
jgi:lantibiotic biosynthesis protein